MKSTKTDKARIDELERALKVIHTWAGFALDDPKTNPTMLKLIADKAEEVLCRK